jgi:hypothetical protein
MNLNVILNLARILGQVLTELSKLKDAMPQQEAVTRGPDELAVAKSEVDQIVRELEEAPPS